MLKVKIEGMTCGHCVMAVTKALKKVPGVSEVKEVSLERGEALLEGSPATEAVLQAIQSEGYQARAEA